MKFQLKTMLFGILTISLCLGLAALITQNRALEARIRGQERNGRFSFRWGTANFEQRNVTDSDRNELQGIAYNLLRRPKYKLICPIVTPQIHLQFTGNCGSPVLVDTGGI